MSPRSFGIFQSYHRIIFRHKSALWKPFFPFSVFINLHFIIWAFSHFHIQSSPVKKQKASIFTQIVHIACWCDIWVRFIGFPGNEEEIIISLLQILKNNFITHNYQALAQVNFNGTTRENRRSKNKSRKINWIIIHGSYKFCNHKKIQ